VLLINCVAHFRFSDSLASLTATITLPRLPFVPNTELHVPCTTLNVWIALVPPLRRAHVFCLHFFGLGQFLMLMASKSRMGHVLKFSPVPDRTLVCRVPGLLLVEL